MLFGRRQDGSIAPADETDRLDKPCYDYKGLARNRAFIERLVDALKRAGFDVYQVDHEDANGQFEVNFTYADCLTTADRMVFFRMAAGEIARELGLICSFMPKPLSDRTGSGMHMHASMADAKNPNLFLDRIRPPQTWVCRSWPTNFSAACWRMLPPLPRWSLRR